MFIKTGYEPVQIPPCLFGQDHTMPWKKCVLFFPFVLCAILSALCASLVFPHLAACALRVFAPGEGGGEGRLSMGHKACLGAQGIACMPWACRWVSRAQQFPIREEADTILSGSSNSSSLASEEDFPLQDRAGRGVIAELHWHCF